MAIMMAMKRSQRYSVADARNQLASLVHDVEAGSPVEITRRGEPVAVLVSLAEYRRLTASRPRLGDALAAFRASADVGSLLGATAFDGTRDRGPGRSSPW